MNKYLDLSEYMRQTKSELVNGWRKMYFDDGEWVVVEKVQVGGKYHVVDRFLDSVPNALEDALKCLDGDDK